MEGHSSRAVAAALKASPATFEPARGTARFWTPDRVLLGLASVGIFSAAFGLIVEPARAAANLLTLGLLLAGLGLGSLFFIAVNSVSGASWHVGLRRVPEAMVSVLPLAAAALFLAFLQSGKIYPWAREAVSSDWKSVWLSQPFFLLRAAVYFLVWWILGRAMIRHSRLQDSDGDPCRTIALRRVSAGFLAGFALTVWLASYDWIMSLEPHWYSTIFGIYVFSGLFLSALTVIALLAIWLRRKGTFHGILLPRHLHDLGKLIFAFSTFWMYIWFSQYMLIWYAGIPEETVYFARRIHGPWGTLFLLNLFLNWVIPFLALLSERAKRDASILAPVCLILLAGRWLDVYLMVFPPVTGSDWWLGFLELGTAAGAAAGFLLLFRRSFRSAEPVPWNDPLLPASIQRDHSDH